MGRSRLSASATAHLRCDCVASCQPGSFGSGDCTAVHMPHLVDGAGGERRPGSGHQFAGNGAVGLGVAVAPLHHEALIELRELWISGPGDVGGLVEGQPKHRGSLLGDGPRGRGRLSTGPVRWVEPDVGLRLLGRFELTGVTAKRPDSGCRARAHAGPRQKKRVIPVDPLPEVLGLQSGPLDPLLSSRQIGDELGHLPTEGLEVEPAVPELAPAPSSITDRHRPSLDVGHATGVLGQRPNTPIAVARDPEQAFHTSGNAQRAREMTRRRQRLASTSTLPRRWTARRRASSGAVGRRAGTRSKNSPALESTLASMGSDLFFPASAERSLAEWRLPTRANSTPAFSSVTANGSHVMDVGSATSMAPGHGLSRLASASSPASVGPLLKSSTTSPARPAWGRRTTM